TGTITLGARQAAEFLPLSDVNERDLAEAAFLSSLADETPEGKSIVSLARNHFRLSDPDGGDMSFVPFTAQTRMSGVDIRGGTWGVGSGGGGAKSGVAEIRKGAADAIAAYVAERAGTTPGGVPRDLIGLVERVGKSGGTPLVVARDGRTLG